MTWLLCVGCTDPDVQAKCVAVKGRMLVHLEMCKERIRTLNSECGRGSGDGCHLVVWRSPSGSGGCHVPLLCVAEKTQSSSVASGDSRVFASASFQNYGKVLPVVGPPSDKGKERQPLSSKPKVRVQGPVGVVGTKAKASSPPTHSQIRKKVRNSNFSTCHPQPPISHLSHSTPISPTPPPCLSLHHHLSHTPTPTCPVLFPAS